MSLSSRIRRLLKGKGIDREIVQPEVWPPFQPEVWSPKPLVVEMTPDLFRIVCLEEQTNKAAYRRLGLSEHHFHRLCGEYCVESPLQRKKRTVSEIVMESVKFCESCSITRRYVSRWSPDNLCQSCRSVWGRAVQKANRQLAKDKKEPCLNG